MNEIQLINAGDAYVHQRTRPPLVMIMAWCLFGAKPLYETMMAYGETFHSRK